MIQAPNTAKADLSIILPDGPLRIIHEGSEWNDCGNLHDFDFILLLKNAIASDQPSLVSIISQPVEKAGSETGSNKLYEFLKTIAYSQDRSDECVIFRLMEGDSVFYLFALLCSIEQEKRANGLLAWSCQIFVYDVEEAP